MKKTIAKKLVGGFVVAMVVAAIGAVLVSAETITTEEDEQMLMPHWGRRHMCGEPQLMSELTVEQRSELDEVITTLKDEGATREEICDAITAKLQEFGIEIPTLDERLDAEIERTEQQLEILNRQKELRNEGYDWEEISSIIQEEFDLTTPVGFGHGMMFRPDFKGGPCRDDEGLSDNDLLEE